MSFTIIRDLDPLPSYPMLCKLAEQHHVRVTGNERTGSFSCRGVEGDYEFGEAGLRGKFAARGVSGQFSLATGQTCALIP